jgi:DNA-binding transcriptional LysR family regulator
MDRLYAMNVFRQVVDAGSFAAAGRALNLSPAGVTRMVALLEDRLGVRLLQRTTRKQVLTQAGEAYLLKVRSILQEVESAELAAAEQTRELQGWVRVLATPMLAATFLSPFIAQWHARHPKVLLELVMDSFPQPRIEAFDLTLLMLDEGSASNMVARPLATSEWIACASPGYLKKAGTPESPDQLRRHAHLQCQWPQGSGHFGKKGCLLPLQGGEPVAVEMTPILVTTSVEMLLGAAVAGAGITFLSRLQVGLHLERGLLVQVLPDWILGRFTVYAALPTRKFMPARTRAFLDFLAEVAPRPRAIA